MKQQLLRLLELQKIDSRVLELRASITAIPEKLAPAKLDLAKLEAMLQAEKDRLAETERWRREQEQMISDDSEALKRAKVKVQQSKSTKEFAAANREVDNKRRSISEREEEVLKVFEAIEKTTEEIAAHESDVETLRQHVAAEDAKALVLIKELEAKATEALQGREETTKGIEERLIKRYEKTLQQKGVAVVPSLDGTCQGCHMQVPAQLNNVLARGESIETCPRCHRLLFRSEWIAEAAAAAASEDS